MTTRNFALPVLVMGIIALASPVLAQEPPVRILVYGDSNTWGWTPTENGFPTIRYADEARFAGVMQAALGNGFEVVVDGLNNRTTNTDDFMDWGNVLAPELNGAAQLPAAIASEMPLDLVVLLLGTNDLKSGHNRTPDDIARGVLEAAQVARASTGIATEYPAPRVVVVTPPPLGAMRHPGIAEFFAGGLEKSLALDAAFQEVLGAEDIVLLRASEMMGASDGFDGVHFTPEDHAQLGRGLAQEIRALFDQ
jgi:lysophospholipase L1-like esterase